ncbi:uncharacterized protein LOC143600362 [Bidens hawaiensis]|uniref:uncharacterized protein LOC143600362 n=1 Tax=Bidens hawaiensis TaxID=980011 RepID=UPI00404B4C50
MAGPASSSDASTGTKCLNGDMAWEWGEWRDPLKKQNIWCTLCEKKVTGGITRLKQHLTHTGGQVTGRVDLSDEDDEDQDHAQEVSKHFSKKRKFVGASDVRGPVDNMLKTDYGKTKQSVPAPSYHNMRVTLLKNRLEETKKFVDSFRPHWEEYRCNIMSDFWTDGKGRCLINFLVNCPLGTVFLKSIDASEHVKNSQLIVEMINEVIKDVGDANIVQFITDNGSNFKASGKILEEQHPKMFWTPCAAHCVNLMIQDITEKILKIKKWRKSDFVKKAVGKKVERIVAKTEFWDNVHLVCQVLAPLVDVVRLVDTEEKLCMGYIYDVVYRANEQIKKNLTDERLITKIWGMIQASWSDQLHHPLHAAGCYLNPAIFHGENSKNIRKNRDIVNGLYVAIDRLVPDEDENDKVRQDLNLYIDSIGQFGSPAAIWGRTKVAPYIWWRTYGIDTPLLQAFAITVLSQTCSASPCERNWSAFDNVSSCYQMLQRRFNSLKANKSLDPILLRDVDENDDWVIPTEVELQDYVDDNDDLLWLIGREAMGGNEEVGASTSSKRSRYRDDDDIGVEVEDLDEQLDSMVDMASEEDFIAYD